MSDPSTPKKRFIQTPRDEALDKKGAVFAGGARPEFDAAEAAMKVIALMAGLKMAETELSQATNIFRQHGLALACLEKEAAGPGIDPLATIRFMNRIEYPSRQIWNSAIKGIGGAGAEAVTKLIVGRAPRSRTGMKFISEIITKTQPVYHSGFVRSWAMRAAALTRADFTSAVKMGIKIVAGLLPVAERIRIRAAAAHFRSVGKRDETAVLRILSRAVEFDEILSRVDVARSELERKTDSYYRIMIKVDEALRGID